MLSMLTVIGTLTLLASTCNAKATDGSRQDEYSDYYDDDYDYDGDYDGDDYDYGRADKQMKVKPGSRQDDYDYDDYFGDYGCDVCWNYCIVDVAGGEYEDYDAFDACLSECDDDYYYYYYGDYYGDDYERTDKQKKISERQDDYDECFGVCEDFCWVSGDFSYDYDFDYDDCVAGCEEAEYYTDDYEDDRAAKKQQRMTKLRQK